jgi:transposase-like protein
MAGRPTKYTPERGEQICKLIATTSLSIRKIAKKIGVNQDTVWEWRAHEPEFRQRWDLARAMRCDLLADEAIEIADDSSRDYVERRSGNGEIVQAVNHAIVNRSRLRIEARLRLLGKWNPHRYGELVRHAGLDAPPRQAETLSFEESQRRAKEEIDRAFPERRQDDEDLLPPPPPPPVEREPEHVIRDFAKDGPREDGVAQLPTRYWRPPRVLGEWSG